MENPNTNLSVRNLTSACLKLPELPPLQSKAFVVDLPKHQAEVAFVLKSSFLPNACCSVVVIRVTTQRVFLQRLKWKPSLFSCVNAPELGDALENERNWRLAA